MDINLRQHNANDIGRVENINFADVTNLERHVDGNWSEWGEARVVTHGDIASFGTLTQNQQWIHTDADRCRLASPYGNIIAHGLFILTLIPSLLPPETFRVVGHQQRIVRGCNHFRFPAPVYPGESVQARAKLRAITAASSGKGTILTRDIEVVVAKDSPPAVTAKLLLQYF